MSSFTHLHVHSEYSLLDGACRIPQLISRTKELGMDSIAITDHGVMYGVVDFYKEAKKAGLRPIIGTEAYIASHSRFDRTRGTKDYFHLVLLAKNKQGYKNLLRLSSASFIEGFYYKPRIDFDLLREHSEGLVVLSACLGGEVQRLLLDNNYDAAKAVALRYREVFGDDYYLELQNHGLREQKEILPLQLRLIRETGISPVATNDVHYILKPDAHAQDVLLCLQTGATIGETNRMRMDSSEFYLKSPEEMASLFATVPKAIENTRKIAEQCDVELEFGKYHLPHFEVPASEGTHEEYLRRIARAGLEERYGQITPEIAERFEYELGTIQDMGFTDYFLIVWDFVRYAKSEGIMVGPGRGSAAGSLVAYCLGITKIDPMKYNLLFERFLNPERITMPDIDIDFCYERRGEVIEYVTKRYGEDKVAQIVTFGTLGARMVIRDVARVLETPVTEGSRIANLVPNVLNMTIDQALQESDKFRAEYEGNQNSRQIIDIARQLEGMPRHTSTHAAGVVISKKPITEYVPLHKNMSDESIATQYGKNQLEALGMLKMDFLGLRTLTVIRDAVALVEKDLGVALDMDSLDGQDAGVYAMMSKGDTLGVFQFESPGMRRLLKDMRPGSLDDLMAANALFRPGPMDSIPEYVRAKKNPSEVRYAHPALEPILQDTYGVMVYQEQIMRIVRDIAGYSMARSDLVRRAMSKKQHSVLERERQIFIYGSHEDGLDVDGALKRGMDERTASALFDQMMAFANYAFNKSHACAYAVVAYQTAFLKLHYPVQFATALFNSFLSDKAHLGAYISAFRASGLKILPPDINRSNTRFQTEGNAVRFGLGAISFVGSSIETAVENRSTPYASFEDFVRRNAQTLNKKALESLILAGCFDSLGAKRSHLIMSYEGILKECVRASKAQAEGQVSFFEAGDGEAATGTLTSRPSVPEYSLERRLAYEKQVTGLYISGHPLDSMAQELMERPVSIADILEHSDSGEGAASEYEGQVVSLVGIISEVHARRTKKKEPMAGIVLEDLTGQTSALVFPGVYKECEDWLRPDQIVEVTGRVSVGSYNGPEILVQEIERHSPASFDGKELCLRLPKGARIGMSGLMRLLSEHKGPSSVVIKDENTGRTGRYKGDLGVTYSDRLMRCLRESLGDDNVVLVDRSAPATPEVARTEVAV